MNQNISCVAIYSSVQESLRAIKNLQTSKVELQNISIMVKQKYCDGVDDVLKCSCTFELAETGLLSLAGGMVEFINDEAKSSPQDNFGSPVNLLQKLLFIIGVPTTSLNEYEQAVKDNKVLLLVHGSQQEVESACMVLHSESQQVTVHQA